MADATGPGDLLVERLLRVIDEGRSTYAHLSAGTPLWRHGSVYELATGPIHR